MILFSPFDCGYRLCPRCEWILENSYMDMVNVIPWNYPGQCEGVVRPSGILYSSLIVRCKQFDFPKSLRRTNPLSNEHLDFPKLSTMRAQSTTAQWETTTSEEGSLGFLPAVSCTSSSVVVFVWDRSPHEVLDSRKRDWLTGCLWKPHSQYSQFKFVSRRYRSHYQAVDRSVPRNIKHLRSKVLSGPVLIPTLCYSTHHRIV